MTTHVGLYDMFYRHHGYKCGQVIMAAVKPNHLFFSTLDVKLV